MVQRRRLVDVSKLYRPYSFVAGANISALHIDCDRTFIVDAPDATEVWVDGVTDSPTAPWDRLGAIFIQGTTNLTMVCRPDSPSRAYLVNIYVPTRTIRAITFLSAGTLVVYPQTLVNGDSLSITNANEGTVFVQDRALSLRSLELHAAGSGSIQWDVPTANVSETVELRTSDAGNVTLFASTAFFSNELKVTTIGSGSIAIEHGLETSIISQLLTIGLGDVLYRSNGTCGNHVINQMGPGTAYTSAIACTNTTVTSASTGDVYLTTTNTLDVNQMGSGSVYYILQPANETLRSITGHVQVVHAAPTVVPPYISLPPHALGGTSSSIEPISQQQTPAPVDKEVVQMQGSARGIVAALDLSCDRAFVIEDPNTSRVYIEGITRNRLFEWIAFGQSEDEVDGDTTLTIVCTPANMSEPHLVNIYVPTKSIRKIITRGDSDVVVYPHVLVSSTLTNIFIQNTGSGNVFVQDNDVQADAISLLVDSAGSIQWTVSTTAATRAIDLHTTGSGSVFIFASTSLETNAMTVATGSSGSIAVSATHMTVSTSLETGILESGGVAYSVTHGTCGHQSIKQMGSGNAYTSSVSCVNTSVLAASTGDIYLSSTNTLDVNQMGSGTVYVQQVFDVPLLVSGVYQLVQTNPTMVVIPPVPVPLHTLNGLQSMKPRNSETMAFGWPGFVVLGALVVCLYVCYTRCYRRRSPKTTRTLSKVETSLAVRSAPYYQSQNDILTTNQCQQQLYDSHSGTINYIDPGASSLLEFQQCQAQSGSSSGNPVGDIVSSATHNADTSPLYRFQCSYGSDNIASYPTT
ncbi:Aste57867_20019 [Aphanomyces stellatus]|uniref:Aste57867_20019 protein n=1 Tax=Aphanomyces stellatus TaxID=120398 RepID=A0A485LF73_9STRA|nr:hypothetical protein As57867_019953 [Aphanomyces stellatus]VFT96715.1 Aste57867_20019 [Aphanomyces stellatus]